MHDKELRWEVLCYKLFNAYSVPPNLCTCAPAGPPPMHDSSFRFPFEVSLQAEPSSMSATDFLVQTLNQHPGEVTVLALAALTNVALALQKDPELHTKWKELVVLGGAFKVSGNVNPAAEANILGDPEAADFVLSRATNVWLIGLDVTHDCSMTEQLLQSLQGALCLNVLWCLNVSWCLPCMCERVMSIASAVWWRQHGVLCPHAIQVQATGPLPHTAVAADLSVT
jgi:Inosine-uridine preferring nucleoside hydrolase